MKTNYQMLNDLENFQPEERGWVQKREMELLNDVLCLKERSDTELWNLRDFTVLYYSHKTGELNVEQDYDKAMATMDKMSSICFAIDNELFRRGRV